MAGVKIHWQTLTYVNAGEQIKSLKQVAFLSVII